MMKDLIRQETQGGEELARFMLEALREEKYPVKDRLDAARWLAEFLFGAGAGYGAPGGERLACGVDGYHLLPSQQPSGHDHREHHTGGDC